MQGRKLRVGRVVGAVVVVGLIVGGLWWAISESGEEESPTPMVVEQVLPQPEPALVELGRLGKEIEKTEAELRKVGEEVSSLKKDIEKRFSPAPAEPALPSREQVILPSEGEEEDVTAAMGKMLHDFADFCTLLAPEMAKVMQGMVSSLEDITVASIEATPPQEVAPPQEEKGGFLSGLFSLGQEEGEPQPGGGFISGICGRLPCYAPLEPCLQFM